MAGRDQPINLKRVALFGVCFGMASGVTFFVAAIALQAYRARPKPWDTGSIECLSSSAVPTYNYNPASKQMKQLGFEFAFVLVNTRSTDYTVPQNLKLFKREKSSEALEDFDVPLDRSFVIPPKERVLVRVRVEYGCGVWDENDRMTERDPQTCFKDAFDGIEGFVGLDYQTRTRLNLRKPVLSSPK